MGDGLDEVWTTCPLCCCGDFHRLLAIEDAYTRYRCVKCGEEFREDRFN